MLFNSIEYLIFFSIIFILYWGVFAKKVQSRNLFLLLVSYVFYGWWDWRFLGLIVLSSTIDYIVGLKIHSSAKNTNRKAFLWISIGVNLGVLGFFKYYNFFAESLIALGSKLGVTLHESSLNVILPVGISFYTFQTMSYAIDVYKNKVKPTKDIIAFFAFVSFFPQLVAGPIERAGSLLPQFFRKAVFSFYKAREGIRLILWGLVKKIVIADNCAVFVNDIFWNYNEYSGSVLFLGVFYFAFQIYCDFSGYSDIAIGSARLLGFDLMNNFSLPYFSRNIGEFWRRWHISLSSWFRDYVFIPLGGSQKTALRTHLNSMATFTISGLWHGANWTFVLWGAVNGLYYSLNKLLGAKKHKQIVASKKLLPDFKEAVSISIVFLLILFSWVLFRSDDITHAYNYYSGIFSIDLFTIPTSHRKGLLLVFFLLVVEWIQRQKTYVLEIDSIPTIGRWAIYLLLVLMIANANVGQQSFIYFQF